MNRRLFLSAVTGCAVAKEAPKRLQGRSFDGVILDDLRDADDVLSYQPLTDTEWEMWSNYLASESGYWPWRRGGI